MKRALYRDSLSEEKMGRHSAICKRTFSQILEQVQIDVPQCKMMNTLNISLSTAQTIWRNLCAHRIQLEIKIGFP